MKNKIKTELVLLFFPVASGSNTVPSGTVSVSEEERRGSRRECWGKGEGKVGKRPDLY